MFVLRRRQRLYYLKVRLCNEQQKKERFAAHIRQPRRVAEFMCMSKDIKVYTNKLLMHKFHVMI